MIDLWAAFCMLERIHNGHNAHLRNVRAAIAGSREEMLLALEQMKASGIYALEVAGSAAYARLTDKNALSDELRGRHRDDAEKYRFFE